MPAHFSQALVRFRPTSARSSANPHLFPVFVLENTEKVRVCHQTARKRGCAQIKSYAKERNGHRACNVIKQFGIAMPHAKSATASRPLCQAACLSQFVHAVSPLPGELWELAAEVPVRRGFAINRTAEVKLRNDGAWAQVEDLVHGTLDVLFRNLVRTERVHMTEIGRAMPMA